MKRIEMLADVRDAPGYLKGEVRVVTPEVAGYLCGNGWAKDLAGDLATGSPDTSAKTLDVHGSGSNQAAQSPGVK